MKFSFLNLHTLFYTLELQASFESLVLNQAFEDAYGDILDATRGLIDFLNATNAVKGALTALTLTGAIKGFTLLKSGIVEAYTNLNQFKQALDISKQANIGTMDFDRLLLLTKNLGNSQLKLIMSSKSLSVAQKELLLVNSGLSLEESKLQLQTWGVTKAQTGLIASTVSLKAAMSSLWTLIASNPLMIAVAGISAATMAWNSYKQKIEEVRQATKDSANAYKESTSSIDDYVGRYEELNTALENARGNEEETRSVKEQLLSLQNELNSAYGSEVAALDLVGGAYEDNLAILKEYNSEKAKAFLNENVEGIKDATKQMTKERHYNLSGMMYGGSDEAEALRDVAEKYTDKGIYINEGTDGTFMVHIRADAQSANETINSFMDDLRDKAKELGNENIFDDVFTYSSAELNRSQEIINEFADTYKQALVAEIVTDNGRSQIYNEALLAVQKYNEAVLNSEDPFNDTEVVKARQNLEAIRSEIQTNTDEWGKYSAVTDDVFNQADTSMIDFNSELKSNKELLSAMESLKGKDAVDLKALNEGENTHFDMLRKAAEKYGLSVDELISSMERLGYVQSNIEGNIPNENPIPSLSISQTVDQLNTQLKPTIDSLAEAYQNIFTEDGFTRENIGLDMFSSIREELDNLQKALDESGSSATVDYSAYEKLVSVLNDTESTAIQIKDAFDEVALSVANISITGLEDFQVLKESLEQLGYVDADLVAFEALVSNMEALKAAGLDLADTSLTESDFISFIDSLGISAEYGTQALNMLTFAQELNKANSLDTSDSVAELLNLANNAGYTGEIIQWLTRLMEIYRQLESGMLDPHTIQDYVAEAKELTAKIEESAGKINIAPSVDKTDWKPTIKSAGKAGKDAGDAYLEAFEKELSALDSLRDRGVISEKEYLDRLRTLYTRYFADRKDYLDEYNKYERQYLEGMKSLYDSALSGISKLQDRQIEGYQDAKDSAVESLEAEKEARLEVIEAQKEQLEAQIDLIDEQIEAKEDAIKGIQDEIDAMQEANDERKRQLDIQQKAYNLGRMMNQRTDLLFKDGQTIYREDTKGVRGAKEELDDAILGDKISKKEKEISLIEDEIELLEETKDAIQEQIDALGEQADSIEKHYSKMISSTEKYYDSLIKNAEKQKSKWEELAEIHDVADAWSAIEQVFGDLGYTVDDVLSGSSAAFDDFKSKYIALISDMNSNSSFTEGLSYATGVAKEDLGSFLDKANEVSNGLDEISGKGNKTVKNNL